MKMIPTTRRIRSSVRTALIAASLGAAAPVLAEAPDPAVIQQDLRQWRGEGDAARPLKNHGLVLVYWTPADREPAPRYRERLSAIMKDIQGFYGREMDRRGYGRMTFGVEEAENDLLRIHLVRGKHPYAHYNVKSGHAIKQEAVPVLKAAGIDANKATVVIFCNMSNWDAEKRVVSQNSPYYASGTHVNGTAWQVDSPILDVSKLGEKGERVRDGQYGNISLGRYNSIFIGGVAHELGHAFGLPHLRESQEQKSALGTALMGSGNRTYGQELRGEGKGSFLTPAHAMRLASHPLFTHTGKQMWDRVGCKVADWDVAPLAEGAVIAGRVMDSNLPVYGVVAYVDPDGGGDYDSRVFHAVPDTEGRFRMETGQVRFGSKGQIRVVFLHSSGAASAFAGPRAPHSFGYTWSKEKGLVVER